MKFNVPPTPAPSILQISGAEEHTRNFKPPVRAKAIRVMGHVSSWTLLPAALASQLWPPADLIGAPRGR
jgi:hypothetical protein